MSQYSVLTLKGVDQIPYTDENAVIMADGRSLAMHLQDLKDADEQLINTLTGFYNYPTLSLVDAITTIVKANYNNDGAFFFHVTSLSATMSGTGTYSVWGYKAFGIWSMLVKQLSQPITFEVSVTASESSIVRVTDENYRITPTQCTLSSNASSTEATNCNWWVSNGLCTVNLAAITVSASGAIVTGLPKAKVRGNTKATTGAVLYIDANGTSVNATGTVTSDYLHLTYPIA